MAQEKVNFSYRNWRYPLLAMIAFVQILFLLQHLPLSTVTIKMKLEEKIKSAILTNEEFTIEGSVRNMSHHIMHPSLHQSCFIYNSLKATFNCTDVYRYLKFNNDLTMKCATNLWNTLRNKEKPNPWEMSSVDSVLDSESVSKREAIHIYLVGDSHIRNFFDALLKRIATSRVKYRLPNFKEDGWRNARLLLLNKRMTRHQRLREVIHLDVPLKITFRWDPLLEELPILLASWLTVNSTRPSHLLLGSALHFIQNSSDIYLSEGPLKASKKFFDKIKNISSLVDELSKTTKVVYKLQDHLQEHPKNNIANLQNIDLYNRIVMRSFNESESLGLWDSTIPLSDLYAQECKLSFRNTPITEDWKCHDIRHVGYIMIEQYVDMYLNDICNKY